MKGRLILLEQRQLLSITKESGFLSRVEGTMSRVEGTMSRVEGTMSRVLKNEKR